MSSHRRRYSKRELLGSLHVDYVMSVSDLGLIPGTNRWHEQPLAPRDSGVDDIPLQQHVVLGSKRDHHRRELRTPATVTA